MNSFNKMTLYAAFTLIVGTGIFMTFAPLAAEQQNTANKNADNNYLKSPAGKQLKKDTQKASTITLTLPGKLGRPVSTAMNIDKGARAIYIAADNATRTGHVNTTLATAEQKFGSVIFNAAKAFLTNINSIILEINASPLSADAQKTMLKPFTSALDTLGGVIICIMNKELALPAIEAWITSKSPLSCSSLL